MDKLLDELKLAEARIAGLILGDAFFQRLDQDDPTHAMLTELAAKRSRRHGLIKSAIAAITNLKEDGYPTLSRVAISEAMLADLQKDFQVLGFSLKEFELAGASHVTATVGPERPTP